MQPTLKFSCPVRWEDMRVGITGRHCFQCDKEVVDFTRGTKADLVQYLLDHRDRSVCGRVRQDQIDVYHEFAEICIWRSLKTKRTSNLAFYLVAISGLSVTGCAPDHQDPSGISTGDLITVPESRDEDSIRTDTDHEKPVPPDFGELTGIVVPAGNLTLEDTAAHGGAFSFPEIMPEFPGGQDSLYAFMKEHLRYPDWESEHNIEGKVYVEFVIGTDGQVSRSRIKLGVKDAMNFDGEVLRVIDMMPPWTPGRNGDAAVPTRLVLPVVFTH